MGLMDIFSELFEELSTVSTEVFQETKGSKANDVFDELFNTSVVQADPQVKGVYKVQEGQSLEGKREQPHRHPMQVNSVAEKKPEYVGSLGAVNTEGCKTHADVRYVAQKSQPKTANHQAHKMREYMVYSEILGKPKCKR